MRDSFIKKLDVQLRDSLKSYPIYVGEALNFIELLSGSLGSNVADILIITNDILAKCYLEKLQEALDQLFLKNNKIHKVVSCVLPDGEKYKSLESFSQIIDVLLKENFHRDVVLIALGGGVIGDLTGFVAASFMRGVSWIQIPTSLLAQVDASVGGKTGINHSLGKNMIGAFYQPKAVLIDVEFLSTLPHEQFHAGMAEVIKHALIFDPDFVDFLLENREKILARDPAVLTQMIFRSCEIKAKIVEQDEREQGLRAILNFGHTLGHAIETCTQYRILHGYAVSIGIFFALKLSCLWTNFPEDEYQKSLILLRAFNLPEKISHIFPCDLFTNDLVMSAEQVLLAMKSDKKHEGNNLKYILLKNMGQPVIHSLDNADSMAKSGMQLLLKESLN